MGLQLIYGRANSGKTEYILNKSLELYKQNRPFVIVVPEQYTHVAEKKLISKIGFIEQGRAEVLSFDRIATRINSTYDNGKRKLNKLAKTLILSEIISAVDFKYYKNASKESGFVGICSDEISEFKKYNISCLDVKNIISDIEDESLKLKLEDIYTIYNEYEATIQSSYSDADDNLAILADNLENRSRYTGYTFIFDEFTSFNPNEKDIILALAKQTDMTYVTVCADFSSRNTMLFKPTRDVANSITDLCKSAGVCVNKPIEIFGNYFETEEMAFLENNIYSYPADSYEDSPENIHINIYDNPYSEISGMAAQISKFIKDNNVRYKDIGVICPDIASYSHIFKHVFNKYNIPFFIDEKVGVLKHSIVSSVINILDVYINNYNSEFVISYLKSAYLNLDRQALVDIDNFITATNSSKNVWLCNERWNKTLNIYCEDNVELYNSITEIRNNYILPLSVFHDGIKGKNTIKYICEKLYGFITDIGFDKNIASYIEQFKADNNKQLQKQYELVWKMLIEALDTLVLILGEKKVNVSQFRNYLFMSLSEQKIGIIPTSIDSVTIGDIKRSKQDSIKYQFIIGAVDGKFPIPGNSNSFITDADKHILSNIGVNLTPDTRQKMLYERFLTYVALTGTDKSLILSYSTSDESSSASRPSFVLTILKNVFPKIKINSYVNSNDDFLISNSDDSLEFLSKQVSLIADGKDADSRWQDIYEYYRQNNSGYIDYIDSIINKNQTLKKLDKTLTEKLFKDEFYSTVSRLQRYNSCRYAYYLEYMLGLKDKKTFDPESTDIGTFVHSCIEKTFKSLDGENKSVVDVSNEHILEILDNVYAECMPELYRFPDDITPKDEYRIKTLKNKVYGAIMSIRSHLANSSFTPLGHEITFNDENLGCIEINLDNNKNLKLTGKIDRADYFDNEDGRYIRVVDYKTGNKVFNISDVYYGLDIQLIVYLNALVKGTNKGHHAGALFFKIQNPIIEYDTYPGDDEIKKSLLKHNAMTGIITDDDYVLNAYSPNSVVSEKKATPTQFKILSEYVESIVKKSAESLSEGEIDINPYKKTSKSPCLYCNFSKICNFSDGENGECRNFDTVSEKNFWSNITKKEDD